MEQPPHRAQLGQSLLAAGAGGQVALQRLLLSQAQLSIEVCRELFLLLVPIRWVHLCAAIHIPCGLDTHPVHGVGRKARPPFW